jgi:hypothetical protein
MGRDYAAAKDVEGGREKRRQRAEDRKQKLRRWEGEMRRGLRTEPAQIYNVELFDFGLQI